MKITLQCNWNFISMQFGFYAEGNEFSFTLNIFVKNKYNNPPQLPSLTMAHRPLFRPFFNLFGCIFLFNTYYHFLFAINELFKDSYLINLLFNCEC